MRTRICSILVAAGMALSMQATGSVIRYDDIPSYMGATTGLNLVDFEGIAPAGDAVASIAINISGVQFIADPFGFVVDDAFAPLFDWSSGAVLAGGQAGATLAMILPAGTTAFGMALMTIQGGAPLFVLLSSGESFGVDTLANPNRSFVGFTSATAISSVLIAGGPLVIPMMDNFSFGLRSVPEPPPLALILAAGIGVLWLKVRRSPSSQNLA